MRIIIRYIESRGVSKETNQSTFDGAIATIGRGTDQSVQIPDRRLPLAHSKITLTAGKMSIAAVGDHRFSVNGQLGKRANLSVNDVINLSGHVIKVLPGEGEAELVLEIEIETEKVEQLRDRFTTRLWQVGIPERNISWALVIIILAAGLIIPASGWYFGMDKLRAIPGLPDDSVWTTGDLHQTHAFMGDDCTYCHTKAFEQTRDEDCLYCHLSVNHHFDTDKFGRDYRTGNACGDCHKEHSTTNSITREDQEACTICHVDIEKAGFDSDKLRPATDFLNDHPTFKLSMQELGEDDEWHAKRIDIWDDDLAEKSNLIFPHDVHLAEEGIKSVDGTVVMECTDCHEVDKGGLKMETVTMEKHCADCHQLTFDPDTPDRVVPHGSPPDLMRTLREYYAYEFLTRGQEKPAAMKKSTLELVDARTSRRPGRRGRTQSITDLIVAPTIDKSASQTEQASAYIEARVADAAENLFEKQTCTICHDISKSDDADVPWQVKQVHLNNDWMPLSVFSHDSHKNMQCDGCHEAKDSIESADVLMPDIGSCRQCHGGEEAENLLQSTCITCHNFHSDAQKPMGELLDLQKVAEKKAEVKE